jgi:hypothetical protein
MAQELSAERLRELVHYDPETGVMTRRISLSNRTKVGDEIGRVNETDGYRYACVDGKSHAVHRLAWLYMTGRWPQFQVTHENDTHADNRWVNLKDRPKADHLAARFKAYGDTRTKIRIPRDGAAAQAMLRALFTYEAGTGLLRWAGKPTKYSNVEVGQLAGSVKSHGYVMVEIDGKTYAAHRLIWVIVTGEWPKADVDHRDTDRSNNRWANLRDVSRRVNAENRRRAQANNSTGLLGAHAHGGRFKSAIKVRGKAINLGTFDTAEEAHRTYVAAKRRLHEGCTL